MPSDGVDDEAKLEALKYLGHWVGDVHQPLHVSFEDDKGGNNISVTGECPGKLHAAWDSCLVVKSVGTDVAVAATDLMKSITPAKIEEWTHSNPVMGAFKSASRRVRALPAWGSAGDRRTTPIHFDQGKGHQAGAVLPLVARTRHDGLSLLSNRCQRPFSRVRTIPVF